MHNEPNLSSKFAKHNCYCHMLLALSHLCVTALPSSLFPSQILSLFDTSPSCFVLQAVVALFSLPKTNPIPLGQHSPILAIRESSARLIRSCGWQACRRISHQLLHPSQTTLTALTNTANFAHKGNSSPHSQFVSRSAGLCQHRSFGLPPCSLHKQIASSPTVTPPPSKTSRAKESLRNS